MSPWNALAIRANAASFKKAIATLVRQAIKDQFSEPLVVTIPQRLQVGSALKNGLEMELINFFDIIDNLKKNALNRLQINKWSWL